ncbi:MAG: imelysin family protein [Bauldia sp.]
MERKTRIWLGLSAAVLVGGGSVTGSGALAATETAPRAAPPQAMDAAIGIRLAQEEGAPAGEGGEGGEGAVAVPGGEVRPMADYRLLSTNPNDYQYDAAAQIAAYGAVAHESYGAAHAAAVALRDAVTALLDAPGDATLAAAHDAWLAARPAYMATEAFRFYGGPIDGGGGPEGRLNGAPVRVDLIDYVAGDAAAGIVNDPAIPLTRQSIAAMNRAENPNDITAGWHVIEFLLWGQDTGIGSSGARPTTDFAAGEADNDRRRDYLANATQLLVNDLANVTAAWAPDSNNYRTTLGLMEPRNVVGRIFNGMAILAGSEMAVIRLAEALETRDDSREHSRFSDATIADFAANLEGIRSIYFGGSTGAGFDVLLAGINPEANARIIVTLDAAEAAIAALDEPFDAILASPPDSPLRAEASTAVEALKDLGRALRDAGNRLGVFVLVPGLR